MAISPAPNCVSDVVVAGAREIHADLSVPVLYEHAVKNGEGKLLQGGTFAVRSGARTGRSPKDKYLVRTPDISEHVWWGQHNQAMTPDTYRHIETKVVQHFNGQRLYVQDCVVSQDSDHRRTVRVITEQAYHSLFA